MKVSVTEYAGKNYKQWLSMAKEMQQFYGQYLCE